MSRLPQKVPKTFDNFDFGVLRGKGLADLEKLVAIRTLAPSTPTAISLSLVLRELARHTWLRHSATNDVETG